MIHPYDNKTQTGWDRGQFQVQLIKANSTRPMGFCDGTPEDMAALRERAESEGADEMRIDKQVLKPGLQLRHTSPVESAACLVDASWHRPNGHD